jgi:hypothetical protein
MSGGCPLAAVSFIGCCTGQDFPNTVHAGKFIPKRRKISDSQFKKLHFPGAVMLTQINAGCI